MSEEKEEINTKMDADVHKYFMEFLDQEVLAAHDAIGMVERLNHGDSLMMQIAKDRFTALASLREYLHRGLHETRGSSYEACVVKHHGSEMN